MKAVVVRELGGPEVLRLEEAPAPQAGPGQVLVRVKAAGVNPVDVYLRSGVYPRKPALPYTPGADAAGVVEALGSGVENFKKGDRVYTAGTLSGACAELALCAAHQVHPLPERVSFAQGAALGVPYATAYRALFHRARAQAGETVLVNGASGGVGVAAVQLARAAGLRVLGTSGTEKGRALALKEGAHEALDHRAPGFWEKVLSLTGGRGADLIVEMLANANLGRDLKVLAPGGRVVVVGSRGPVEIDARDAMSRDAAVLGMSLFNASPAELACIHAALGAGLENGTLRPVIGAELALKDAALAHQKVMEAGAYGKIVLTP